MKRKLLAAIAAVGSVLALPALAQEVASTFQPTSAPTVEESSQPAAETGVAVSAPDASAPAGRRTTRRPPFGGLNLPLKAPPVAKKVSKTTPYHAMLQTTKSHEYYAGAWGVDHLRAATTSSGNLIRFTFRVLQPKLAKPLGDHAASPYLFAPKTRAVLQVPTMEKIGQLRQLGDMEASKEYWMVFSNKGNLVHPGDRVDVMIGKFHADGLLVE
jgi:hypothetical protein